MACSNSGGPPSTGAFVPPEGGIEFHKPNVRIGQLLWLSLPPLQVRKGVRRVTITGVRLAARYAGVALVGTARFSLAQTRNRLITIASPADLKQYSIQVLGPFVGTIELPGEPVDYGAIEVRFDRPGVVEIVNVVLRYRTSDGSGEQLIPCDFRLTVSP